MLIFATISGIVVILAVLLDAFETVVLPRRVRRKFRITVWFYRTTWIPWRKITGLIKSPGRRENFLGYFGPLSLLFLARALGLRFDFRFWVAAIRCGRTRPTQQRARLPSAG